MSYFKFKESGSRLASPTPQPHHPPQLGLRTATSTPAHQSQTAPQQTSAQDQRQYPTYPIPIPPHKLAKAIELYRKYLLADRIAQSPAVTHHGYFLSVPGAPSAASVTSRGSSQRGRSESIATSNFEATGSVLSFDGAQSPSSVKQGEKTTFNGKTVKTHNRKKLPSPDREKAALIRYLKACWPCRDRRVPCPLEHHDIDALRRGLHEHGPRSQAQRQPQSSHSSSSQNMTSNSRPMQRAPSVHMQMNALFDLGAHIPQTQPVPTYDTTLDIQTPGGAYANPQTDGSTSLIYGASNLPALNPDPYGTYSDGSLLALAVKREDFFFCQCLTLCSYSCVGAEELQSHFEMAHFAFDRIHPASRYVCARCSHLNNHLVGPCSNCSAEGSIEHWIYGKYIRNPSYRRHGPQGGDLPTYRNSSSTYDSIPYTFGNFDSQYGSNMDGSMDDGNFDGNITPGNYDLSDSNGYGGPSSQGYGYDPFSSFGSGSQFQGTSFRSAKPFTAHIIFPKSHRLRNRLRTMLLILVVLIAITFGYIHDSIISQARLALSKSKVEVSDHLPMLGLIGIAASFAACLSVKHISDQRLRRAKGCPLHALTSHPLGIKLRQSVPETYLRGGVYS